MAEPLLVDYARNGFFLRDHVVAYNHQFMQHTMRIVHLDGTELWPAAQGIVSSRSNDMEKVRITSEDGTLGLYRLAADEKRLQSVTDLSVGTWRRRSGGSSIGTAWALDDSAIATPMRVRGWWPPIYPAFSHDSVTILDVASNEVSEVYQQDCERHSEPYNPSATGFPGETLCGAFFIPMASSINVAKPAGQPENIDASEGDVTP